MEFRILEFVEGARQAKGLAVIIDVFRAFSVACYAYDSGAVKIIATGEVDPAFRLRSGYRNSVLVGERDERKIVGFDFGNSPTEIIKSDLTGKVVIQTTTAGTNGLLSAENADLVITGSLVNAAAIARFITMANPEIVSFVAMGYRALESAPEDLLCAEYIISQIKGEKESFEEKISRLRFSSGERFFKPANLDFSPPTDFFLCTTVNRFDFILKAIRRLDGNIDLEKVAV